MKLGAKGSALFVEGEKPIKQSIIPAARVLDTTGAGDTFTASFAVAFVEGKPREECLRFAGTLVRKMVVYVVVIFTPQQHRQKNQTLKRAQNKQVFIILELILRDNQIFIFTFATFYSCSCFSLCPSEGSHS